MLKITTSGTQNAKEEMAKAIKQLITDKFVTVGMHEDSGMHPVDGEEDPITNAQLGAIQHYGSGDGNTPPRAFLDVGVASGNAEYLKIIADTLENDGDIDQALEQIGVVATAKVKQYMVALSAPPNATSTIMRKGSMNPLIDTGALVQSVNYAVQTGKPVEGIE